MASVNDRYAAGELVIRREFATRHKDEISASRAPPGRAGKAEHPLHRIMGIEEQDGAIVL
jgi:hypothetical protein